MALLLGCSVASASVVQALSVEDMSARADLIVQGLVLDQQAAWTRGGRIFTTVRVQVSSRLKGQSDDVIEVKHLGGIVGGVGQQVEGEAHFQNGQAVLLFLKRTPLHGTPSYRVVGLSQGKFLVKTGPLGTSAVQDLRGLGTIAQRGAPIVDPPGESIPLEQLEARIRKVVSGSDATHSAP
jgi:hypothetical protein